jgi:hypothetical protein
VKAGGTLIVEGSTSTIFPEYHLTNGVTVETPANLFVRGSVMRGMVTDKHEPDRLRIRGAGAGVLQHRARCSTPAGRVPAEFAGFGGGGGPVRPEHDPDGDAAHALDVGLEHGR